ncbi:MAG: hypothetical protein GY851_22105 [bacterium]|nr:hypothetical protein [bacterium]
MDDNVHKDFHGALSFGIQFLERTHGEAGVNEFFTSLAGTVYKDLVEDLKQRGLPALEEHWTRIFTMEDGEFDMEMDGDTLVLQVHKCPAVHHMIENDYAVATQYCEHTRLVNAAVCKAAGYEATVDYDQDKGQCVQRFRKAAEDKA